MIMIKLNELIELNDNDFMNKPSDFWQMLHILLFVTVTRGAL